MTERSRARASSPSTAGRQSRDVRGSVVPIARLRIERSPNPALHRLRHRLRVLVHVVRNLHHQSFAGPASGSAETGDLDADRVIASDACPDSGSDGSDARVSDSGSDTRGAVSSAAVSAVTSSAASAAASSRAIARRSSGARVGESILLLLSLSRRAFRLRRLRGDAIVSRRLFRRETRVLRLFLVVRHLRRDSRLAVLLSLTSDATSGRVSPPPRSPRARARTLGLDAATAEDATPSLVVVVVAGSSKMSRRRRVLAPRGVRVGVRVVPLRSSSSESSSSSSTRTPIGEVPFEHLTIARRRLVRLLLEPRHVLPRQHADFGPGLVAVVVVEFVPDAGDWNGRRCRRVAGSLAPPPPRRRRDRTAHKHVRRTDREHHRAEDRGGGERRDERARDERARRRRGRRAKAGKTRAAIQPSPKETRTTSGKTSTAIRPAPPRGVARARARRETPRLTPCSTPRSSTPRSSTPRSSTTTFARRRHPSNLREPPAFVRVRVPRLSFDGARRLRLAFAAFVAVVFVFALAARDIDRARLTIDRRDPARRPHPPPGVGVGLRLDFSESDSDSDFRTRTRSRPGVERGGLEVGG